MTKQFEIFSTQSALTTKNTAINTLLGYPNEETDTERYRDNGKWEHPTSGLWAGIVGDALVGACSKMTHEERLPYYDDSDLKSYEWMKDNGWFPDPEI